MKNSYYHDKTTNSIRIGSIQYENAKTSQAHIATVHLGDDMNLAFVIRAAACFGAKSVMVIGSLPPYQFYDNSVWV